MKIFFNLIYNLSILISISIISGFIEQKENKEYRAVINGVLFGSAAVIGMLNPLVVTSGLIFDARSVIISLAGLFFGPLAAAISGGMALILRVSEGGVGTTVAVLEMFFSVAVGSILYFRNKRLNCEVSIKQLFFMGIIVHLVMLLLLSTIPGDNGTLIVKLIGVPALILYPLATVLIGKILLEANLRVRTTEALRESEINLSESNEELNATMEELVATEEELRSQFEELQTSEERFRTVFEQSPIGITLNDPSTGKYSKVNSKFAEITGKTVEELMNTSWKDITHPDDININEEKMSLVYDNKIKGFNTKKRYVWPDGKVIWASVTLASVKLQGDRASEMCFVEDITEEKLKDEELKASEETFRRLFEGSSDAVFIAHDNKFIDCNAATLELLGYESKGSILGKYCWEISPEKQPDGEFSKDKILRIFESTRKNKKAKYEWLHEKKDGTLLLVEIMMTNILLNGKDVFHILWRDISEQKQMEQELEYLIFHDQLTGLYNRRFFEEELKRLDVERNFPLTIVMADVNGLKLINDSLGHYCGDELLMKVAAVMQKGCRADDIVARLGGDEFVIILPKTDTYKAEQIIKRIEALALLERVASVGLSVSFGYETKENDDTKIQVVLKNAEDHMYKKKLFESPSMRGETINTIISTLHEKNKREEQHSHRVSSICQSMGQAIGLPDEDIKELKTVGLLHDIGKIAIDENILNKPGKLTEDEWDKIKSHPEIGYRILSTVNDMSDMAEFILAHHERWDGKGYPKGLKGEQIPLQSRIIAIADAYDAMTSERSYRNAKSCFQAIG